jgi:hypothetical protein
LLPLQSPRRDLGFASSLPYIFETLLELLHGCVSEGFLGPTVLYKRSSSSIFALTQTLIRRLVSLRPLTEITEDEVVQYKESVEENDESEQERFEQNVIGLTTSSIDAESESLMKLIEKARSLENRVRKHYCKIKEERKR